jgi:hypothetical protein
MGSGHRPAPGEWGRDWDEWANANKPYLGSRVSRPRRRRALAICCGASSGRKNTAPGIFTRVRLGAASSVARWLEHGTWFKFASDILGS